MAREIYTGVSEKARKIKSMYAGVNGVARKVSKVYVGVGDKARLAWSAAPDATVVGVEWNYAATSPVLTRLTRANDPNGHVTVDITTEPVAAVGTGAGSSPFDALMPWMDMDEFNVINNAVSYRKGQSGFSRGNDTVVRIPKYWYKIQKDTSTSKMRFYISDNEIAGFEVHAAFNRGDGKVRDYIYAGKYDTSMRNGVYISRTASSPQVSMTRATARITSSNKGVYWWQWDYAAWCAIWLLYLVEYASWDSQAKIGRGYVDGNSAAINSGGTDSMVYHTGRAAGTDGKTAVQYRGIENLWGNVYQWCDGINFSDRRVYVSINPANFADDTDTNYTLLGSTVDTILSSSGYIKGLGVPPSPFYAFAFLPSSVGGSETTYIPDYLGSNTGWRVLRLGGAWDSAGLAGLFCFYASSTSSSTYSYIGSRLLFLP